MFCILHPSGTYNEVLGAHMHSWPEQHKEHAPRLGTCETFGGQEHGKGPSGLVGSTLTF